MSYARTLIKLTGFQIVSGADTIPYSSENVPYDTDASAGTTVKAALDLLFAVTYPNTKPAVDTYADLPLAGNSLRDYRMVLDDGDGKAAGYRWEQREGDVAPKWYKVHDMDWSNDAILAAFIDQTLDLYVSKMGRQDLDESGNPLTGPLSGQHVYGGTDSGSNLTLHANAGDPSNAPADQTGYIQFDDDARPTSDDSFDLGTALERFRNAYISGDITDGTNAINVDEMVDAFLHSQDSGNPHNTSYDDLSNKLGTLTLNGDATGSVDMSTSGAKTLTVAVNDDSHQHTKATLPNFDADVYAKVKQILEDTTEVAWTFDDPTQTASPDVTVDTSAITDVATPEANKLLVSNAAGDEWVASSGEIELTGDVSGSGTYSSTTDRWSLTTMVENTPLDSIDRLDLTNKTFTSVAGNPTTLPLAGHGLQSGQKLRVFATTFNGSYVVTVVDANTVTIPVTTAAPQSGFYIPEGAHFLYDPDTDMFLIRKEFEDIRLGELSGLNEDVLTQYVAIAGRSGGQTVHGGISASESLVLESTAHATKGTVQTKDTLTPYTDATYSGGWSGKDLGSSGKRFNNLYLAGEAIGLRVENLGSLPSSSGQRIGRLFTYAGDIFQDTGAAIKRLFSVPTLTGNAGKALVVNTGATDLVLKQLEDKDIYLTANGLNMTLEAAIMAGIMGNGLANDTTQVDGTIATANAVNTHTVPTDAIGFNIQGNKGNLDLDADVYFTYSTVTPDATTKIGHLLESSRDMGTIYVKKDVKVTSAIAGAKYTLTWLRKV